MFHGKTKKIILLAGDLAILYVSLAILVFLRYGGDNFMHAWERHLSPFSLLFLVWILSFYIFGLYRYKIDKKIGVAKEVLASVALGTLLSITVLYFFENMFQITPKMNMVIFATLVLILKYVWQNLCVFTLFKVKKDRVILIGNSETIESAVNFLETNGHIGYEITNWIKDVEDVNEEKIKKSIKENKAKLIVIQSKNQDPQISSVLREANHYGVSMISFWQFYENIFDKIPVDEIENGWFVSNVPDEKTLFEASKRSFDVLLGTSLLITLSPIILLSLFIIPVTSEGSAVYKQKRVGKKGKVFTLYKLRTMRIDAEKNGPKWSQKNDNRATRLGKFLRKTHLDELPQLINIIRGDLSFVGPRPERPEFVGILEKEIPFYNARHAIRPGITGWAQIRYRYGSSVNDAKEKLQYDLYYIKNKSLFMDILITIKTVRMLFISN